MTPFEAFQTYLALKLHFTEGSDYDFLKNPKAMAKPATFEKRRDRFWFEKVSKKFSRTELVHFFVANIVTKNRPTWVGDLLDDDAEQCYMDWRKRVESLTYTFETDINTILELMEEKGKNFNELFSKPANALHPILMLYFHRYISLETLVILDKILNCFRQFDRELPEDLLWREVSFMARKYAPFLPVEIHKMKAILRKKVISNDGRVPANAVLEQSYQN